MLPTLRGTDTGILPDGFVSPNKISATAVPVSCPKIQPYRIASRLSSTLVSDKGRPEITTETIGLPVLAKASINSFWSPISSISLRSPIWVSDQASREVDSFPPIARIIRSASLATFTALIISLRFCSGPIRLTSSSHHELLFVRLTPLA